MARSKSRAAVIAVPQSRPEAADYLRQIGDQQRVLARIEADMNDRIATAKSLAEGEAAMPHAQLLLLTEGLKTWCDANRAALTDNNRTKSADLGTGTVSWRLQPAKVTLKSLETVLGKLKELRYRRFIRIKEEVNKEAILAAPAAVKARLATISGLTIGSDGEAFSAEPFEATLAGGAGMAGAAGAGELVGEAA